MWSLFVAQCTTRHVVAGNDLCGHLFVAQCTTRHVVAGDDLCGHCLLLSELQPNCKLVPYYTSADGFN